MKDKVGFIGLGFIGLPMAKNMVKKGYDVSVCGHLRRDPVEEIIRDGAVECSTPREVAENSDIVISIVRDQDQTDEVIRGENGVLAGLKADSTLIIMSTLSLLYCQSISSECTRLNIGFLDAPVSGGQPVRWLVS